MDKGIIFKILHERSNIPLKKICSGLCSEATYYRIVNEGLNCSRSLFEALIQRMGKSPDKYEYLTGTYEQDIYEMRINIMDMYIYGYEDSCERLILDELNILKKKLRGNDTISKQFISKMRLLIADEQVSLKKHSLLNEETSAGFLKVLRITVPKIKIGKLNDFYLSLEELRIYFLIGIKYMEHHDIVAAAGIYKEILDYLDARYIDSEERVKLYPQVSYHLVVLYYEEGRYEDMLPVCEKGISLLTDVMCLYFLPELMHMKAEAMKELHEGSKSGTADVNSTDVAYKDYDKWKAYAECLDDIIQEHADDDAEGLWKHHKYKYIYDKARNCYLINEVIKSQRKLKGMTQEKLSEGICTVENMSRIETGVKTPNMRNYQRLMKKLGLNTERYQSRIYVNDFSILERDWELTICIVRRQYKEAEEIFKNILPCISENIQQNKQYIIMTRAIIDRGLERISAQEKLNQCEEALLCTVPSYKKGEKNFVKGILSVHEIVLLGNIISLHKELGELQYATDLLKEMLNTYEELSSGRKHHIGNYTFLLAQYASNLGLQGNYDDALDKHKEVLRLSIQYGYGQHLGASLYGIAWNLLRIDKSNKEACKKLCRQAYVVYETMKRDYMVKWMKTKFKEIFMEDII